MNSVFLEELIRDGIEHGQRQLADTIRTLIYRKNPELFDRMDFEDDCCFLEPLLFAYFTAENPSVALEQLVDIGNRKASLQLRTPLCVHGTAIEVFRSGHPLLTRFFTDDAGAPVTVEVEAPVRRHMAHLDTAFLMLRHLWPDYYEAVTAVTRRVVIYRGRLPNSFATLSAHGAAFFNAATDNDEVFFLEDVAHQCGHIIFNAVSLDKARFLAIDPGVPLSSLNRDPNEPRTVYSAFHGLFTYTAISQLLVKAWEAGLFAGHQFHELQGRLAFLLNKFGADLVAFDHSAVFAEDGWSFYQECRRIYHELICRYGYLNEGFDLSNLPYVFNYGLFAQRNPLSVQAALG